MTELAASLSLEDPDTPLEPVDNDSGQNAGHATASKRISALKSASYDLLSMSVAVDEKMRNFIRGNLKGKFARRFVEIEVDKTTSHGKRFTKKCRDGENFFKSEDGAELLLDFLNRKPLSEMEQEQVFKTSGVKLSAPKDTGSDKTKQKKASEDHTSVRLCMLMNGIERAMVGDQYRNRYHWVGNCPPRNPDSSSYNEDGGDKPDIIVLTIGRETVIDPATKKAVYYMHELSSVCEGKTDPAFDMDLERSVVQMMKYTSRLVLSHPIAGPIMSFTWCGERIRYWICTPDNYSSSQLINLSNPTHDEEFVKMIAYLGEPIEQVLPSWRPGPEVRVSKPDRNEAAKTLDWRDRGPGLLYNRLDLTFSRSSIFIGTVGPEQTPVVAKAAWLDPSLAKHEYMILCVLQGEQPLDCFPGAKGSDGSQTLGTLRDLPYLAQIKSRITKPFGHWVVPSSGDDQFLYMPSQPEDECDIKTPKVLSVLYTEGLPDLLVKDEKDLSLKRLVGLLNDLMGELHYAACYGVHYRDINTGNVVLRDTTHGKKGCFIDYGNAVYAGERRRADETLLSHKKACEEDGRSANPLFICLDSLKAQELSKKVDRRQTNLDSAEGPDEREEARLLLEAAQKDLNQHALHRYTSDLESLLYWFCYELGERTTFGNPALGLMQQLEKESLWEEKLRPLMKSIVKDYLPVEGYAVVSKMVTDLASVINKSQSTLRKTKRSELVQGLTPGENDCFKQCFEITENAYSRVPELGPITKFTQYA